MPTVIEKQVLDIIRFGSLESYNNFTEEIPNDVLTLVGGCGVIVDSLLATNGYIVYSNGLILQWGYTGNKNTAVYPVSFQNNVFCVVAVAGNGIPNGAMDITNKGFTVKQSSGNGIETYWVATGV